LKISQKNLNSKEEVEEAEDDEEIPQDRYKFVKLDEKINRIFSEYAERRWIVIITQKEEGEEEKKN